MDTSDKASAKTSLDVMVELYRRGVWRDAKTVNVIATACLSDITRVMVTGLNFFLGKDEEGGGGGEDKEESDSEDELPTIKSATMANKVGGNVPRNLCQFQVYGCCCRNDRDNLSSFPRVFLEDFSTGAQPWLFLDTLSY